MKIRVVKEFTFEAAHYLPNYVGPCQHLHGHTYRCLVELKGDVVQPSGMVIDFVIIKAILWDNIFLHLDHTSLNHVKLRDFPAKMPTAENMVIWMVGAIRQLFAKTCGISVSMIRLYETTTSYAEWRDHD